ncbi:thioesterase family protein [Kribbella sp. NPDC048915]|uniref:acyl-CoA thioesterase n=1 Tax=Kribbella sp. NPDC048915 TaxID=3155148 RepID=UPI0033CEB3F3
MDRAAYPHHLAITLRWKDNDVYGHVNNVEYYSFFDTVINDFLIRRGGLDIHRGEIIGLCVDSQCTFKQSLSFPGVVDAGLRCAKLGTSSVRYEIALFREDSAEPAATGRFVHVFVGRDDRRPVPVPDAIRAALDGITP